MSEPDPTLSKLREDLDDDELRSLLPQEEFIPQPPPRVVVPPLPEPKPIRFPRLTLAKTITELIMKFQFGKTKNTDIMKLKPGVNTTEFWIAIGAGVLQVGMVAMGMLDGAYAATGTTILGSLYILIRGGLKSKEGS
jgi:hypothetical protein